MQIIRRWHLYLSCFFSPLLVYFSLSGAWQTFRFNDIPRGTPPSISQRFFHELSKPHKDGILPSRDPKLTHSNSFNLFAVSMALGIAATSIMGILLALQLVRRRRPAIILLTAGALIPICLLFL